MRVAVIGATGQLGADVVDAFQAAGHQVTPLGHADIDLRDRDSINRALAAAKPEVVVNTAAMHNVDACEVAPAEAYAVNAGGVRDLAAVCSELGARLVHVSTDYVFSGYERTAAYSEKDLPGPVNVYGNSKLAGEYYVLAMGAGGVVLRTSAIYGTRPCRAKGGDNFVRLMLRLARERGEVKVVEDEFVSPTYTVDIAQQILTLCEANASGLFHGTSQGQCSWFEFANEIFSLAGLTPRVTPARSGDFVKKTPRPAYSVLDNAALRESGLDRMPHWKDSLRRYIATI